MAPRIRAGSSIKQPMIDVYLKGETWPGHTRFMQTTFVVDPPLVSAQASSHFRTLGWKTGKDQKNNWYNWTDRPVIAYATKHLLPFTRKASNKILNEGLDAPDLIVRKAQSKVELWALRTVGEIYAWYNPPQTTLIGLVGREPKRSGQDAQFAMLRAFELYGLAGPIDYENIASKDLGDYWLTSLEWKELVSLVFFLLGGDMERGEGLVEKDASKGARPPKDETEQWAAESIRLLTELDPDKASEENKEGFNKGDSLPGHSFSVLIRLGLMTDDDWAQAVKIAWRYPRQVGRPGKPVEEKRTTGKRGRKPRTPAVKAPEPSVAPPTPQSRRGTIAPPPIPKPTSYAEEIDAGIIRRRMALVWWTARTERHTGKTVYEGVSAYLPGGRWLAMPVSSGNKWRAGEVGGEGVVGSKQQVIEAVSDAVLAAADRAELVHWDEKLGGIYGSNLDEDFPAEGSRSNPRRGRRRRRNPRRRARGPFSGLVVLPGYHPRVLDLLGRTGLVQAALAPMPNVKLKWKHKGSDQAAVSVLFATATEASGTLQTLTRLGANDDEAIGGEAEVRDLESEQY